MVCFDSTFLIDLLRGNKTAAATLERYESVNADLFISTISVMELVNGVHLSSNIEKEYSKVKGIVSSFLELNFDIDCAFLAGKIEADLTKKGEMIETEDIMIAATAINNNQILLTRNKKHFENIAKLKIESY